MVARDTLASAATSSMVVLARPNRPMQASAASIRRTLAAWASAGTSSPHRSLAITQILPVGPL